MKTIILLVFLTSYYSYSQRLDTQDLYKILREKSAEKQTEFLLSKKFLQINAMQDSTLTFIFDKSNSRVVGLDKEIVKIFRDTITYIIYNPKVHLKFKSKLNYASKKKPSKDNEGNTMFHLMKSSVIFEEKEILKSENNVQREYVYKCFLKK